MEPLQKKRNLTAQLEEILVREIMDGVYPPGSVFPSEFESVKRFQVSRVTVRRVYANLERQGVLVRKMRCNTLVSDRLTAAADPITLVGVLLQLENDFAREFLDGLNREASREKALIVLAPPFRNSGEQGRAAADMVCRGVRNLVIWGCDHELDLALFQRLRLLGINLVFFDHVAPGKLADYVSLDNEHAIRTLLDKAVADGCRKFVFLNTAGLEVTSNRERESCFTEECRRRNLDFEVTSLPWRELLANGAPDACRRFFAQLEDPERTAIVGVNDFLAGAIRNAVGGRGRYYSISARRGNGAENFFNICQPIAEMARECFNLLREQQSKGRSWKAAECRLQGRPDWE